MDYNTEMIAELNRARFLAGMQPLSEERILKINELLSEGMSKDEAQKFTKGLEASLNNSFYDGLEALSRGKYSYRGTTFRAAGHGKGFPESAELKKEFDQLVKDFPSGDKQPDFKVSPELKKYAKSILTAVDE